MRARATMATLLASVTLLVGCGGGGDEPAADPTPIIPSSSSSEPSPSESEAAEEAPPAMPEAARVESTAGAEAFMDYWAEVLTVALNSGDTSVYDQISKPRCESCGGTSDIINRIYDLGGYIESAGWTVEQIAFNNNSIASEPVVRIRRGRETLVERRGAEPQTSKADLQTYTFRLEWAGGEWSVDQFATAD